MLYSFMKEYKRLRWFLKFQRFKTGNEEGILFLLIKQCQMNIMSFQESELAAREARIRRLCEMELKFILLFQETKSAFSFCKGEKNPMDLAFEP